MRRLFTNCGTFAECLNDELKKKEVDKCAASGTGLETLKLHIMEDSGSSETMEAYCQ